MSIITFAAKYCCCHWVVAVNREQLVPQMARKEETVQQSAEMSSASYLHKTFHKLQQKTSNSLLSLYNEIIILLAISCCKEFVVQMMSALSIFWRKGSTVNNAKHYSSFLVMCRYCDGEVWKMV